MNNIILVSATENAAQKFLAQSNQQEQIATSAINAYYPDKNGYTIEQIRSIIDLTAHQFGEKSVFVLWGFDSAKEVVQNAFLKVLEEHSENIQFILVVASESTLLPTIISRATVTHVQTSPTSLSTENEQQILAFIQAVQKSGTLASTLVKTSPQKKREEITLFIEQFITYGYRALRTSPSNRIWLAKRLKLAIEALPLITQNYLDSEAVLDNIFLS